MGQYFYLFNIDKRVWHPISGSKFGEWFPSMCSQDTFSRQLLPMETLKFPEDPLEGQHDLHPLSFEKSTILSLATELHEAIFTELTDPLDVFAFCLTTPYFWVVGLRRYKELYQEYVGRIADWSGDRLVCMGDYAIDWPEEVTEADIKRLQSERRADGYEDDEYSKTPFSILTRACVSLRDVSWPSSYQFRQRTPLQSYYDDEKPLYKFDFSDWTDLPHKAIIHRKALDRNQICVLRNLSKKEYVRADLLALEPEDINKQIIKGMPLDALVTARIPWSNDPSMAMAYSIENNEFHRGKWAGNRFDIVTLSDVDYDWKDVSLEAKEELGAIWLSEYDEGWEAIVRH